MLFYFNVEGINYYFLCPFICFFLLVGSSYTAGQSAFGQFTYIQNIIISFSEILAFIPYLISLKMDENTFKNTTKRNSLITITKNPTNKSLSYQLEYNNIEEEITNIKYYDILLLGFIDFLQSFATFYGNELYPHNYQIYFWSSYIIFLCIFKKLLLKTNIYRHQILSFFIFFVFDIIYTILILTDDSLDYDKKHLIFLIISNCCFSFEIVFEKRLIEFRFVSIYKLCFLLGLSTLFYNLLISIITTIIKLHVDPNHEKYKYLFKFSDYFNEVEDVFMEIILIFIFIILYALFNIFQFITIKYLTPNHTLITQIILALYITIINKLSNYKINLYTFIFATVFHVIYFIVLLIFLEIIQLNFCDINRDTKYSIGIRSEVDKYDNKPTSAQNKAKDYNNNERAISMSEYSDANNSFDSYNN